MAKKTKQTNLYACPEFGVIVEAKDPEEVQNVLNTNL